MNVRIKFQKYGSMKFVGHLDIMRFFQKAIRRANIDIAYSEGYSPHQIMSFAAPLGVGLTSDGEYFDIEVNSAGFGEDEIQRLNQAMVEGIAVLGYQILPDAVKPSMSLVAAADYLAYVKPDYLREHAYPEPGQEMAYENMGSQGLRECLSIFCAHETLQDKVQAFYEGQEEILVTKQTKKKSVEMDLKQLIYKMEAVGLKDTNAVQDLLVKNPELLSLLSEGGEGSMLFLQLCTGSSDNLKPELVLEAFCGFCGVSYNPFLFQIHRLEVYAKADEVPVKGELARKEYLEHLEEKKKACQREGRAFPRFCPLGTFG